MAGRFGLKTQPIATILNDIQDLFQFFDDPKDKYAQLIDFGKKSPGLSNEDLIEENRIYGCASNAWVKIVKNDDETYLIQTDSDAMIVKGLLSLLEQLFNNQTKSEIMSIKGSDLLSSLGLGGSISSQRTNGFTNAISKIQSDINI